jgi:hypothetical protein
VTSSVANAARQPSRVVTRGCCHCLTLPPRHRDQPPHFVTYDYFAVQRLSYPAFSWPVQRQVQIGTKYGHQPLDELLSQLASGESAARAAVLLFAAFAGKYVGVCS